MEEILKKTGLRIPEVLLPVDGIDKRKWSVIACDQYTSQPEYWRSVTSEVGDEPSALNIVFPEALIVDGGAAERVNSIHEHMSKYMADGVLGVQEPGLILVERTLPSGKKRRGLLACFDLEHYDYAGGKTLIRTTEGTIMDRLPTRVDIRKGSPIELPHIMVLIDDPNSEVIDPLFERSLEPLYNFEMMMGAGQLKGWAVDNPGASQAIETLSKMIDSDHFGKKYGVDNEEPFLYAMGDGNHSFAAAKVIWEEIRDSAEDKEAVMDHPARYALAEIVNLHDDSLTFEAIHRVVFNIDVSSFVEDMQAYFDDSELFELSSKAEMESTFNTISQMGGHVFRFVHSMGYGVLDIPNPIHNGEYASFHDFLDPWLEQHPEASLDYIHDAPVVDDLGSNEGNIGFFLSALDKHKFFKTIIHDGPYPRKTFSLGESDEKRFYLEARKIT